MAVPPPTKTAAQYIADATRGSVQAPSAKTAPVASAMPKLTVAGGKDSNSNQSPLKWLLDIVSRPLYSVTDAATGMVNAFTDQQAVLKKGGSLLDAAPAAYDALLKNNQLTGLFSTDKANKSTTSGVIEHATDKLGKLNDPNYKDSVDNVNPILKGVAGFVGDVALDPTTYIPGVLIAKVAKGALGAGKAVSEGLKAGAVAAKDTLQVAAKAADKGAAAVTAIEKDATKIVAPTVDTAIAADAAKAVEAPIPLTPDQHATNTAALLAKIAETKPGKDMTAMAKQVSATEFKASAKVAVDTTKAEHLPWDATPNSRNWMQEAVDTFKSTAKDLPLSKFPKVSVGGQDIPLPIALQRAIGGDNIAITDLKHWHETKYVPLFQQAQSKGILVGPLLNQIKKVGPETVSAAHLSELSTEAADAQAMFERLSTDPAYLASEHAAAMADQAASTGTVGAAERAYTPEMLLQEAQQAATDTATAFNTAKAGNTTPVQTIATAMTNFSRAKVENAAALEAAFGSDLVHNLSKFTSPATYEKAISDIKGILDGSIDLTSIKALTSPMRHALEHLGLDTTTLPVGIRHVRANASLTPAPTTIEKMLEAETVAKMAGKPLNIADELATVGVNRAVLRDLIEGKKLPHTSNTGTKRSAAEYGDGFGRNLREANTYYQWNIMKPMFGALKAHSMGFAGKPLAIFKSQYVTEALRKAENFMDAQGVPMTVGVGIDRIPIGQSQIFDILMSTDREVSLATLWNAGTAVPPTNLLDAIHVAVTKGNAADVEAMLRQSTTRHLRQNGAEVAIPNNLVKGGNFSNAKLMGEALVVSLRDTIMKSLPMLRKQVEENAANYQTRGIAEANLMSDVHLKYLEDTYANGTIGDILSAINGVDSRVSSLSKEIGATQLGRDTTEVLVTALVPAADVVKAGRAVKTAELAVKVSEEAKGTPIQVMDKAQAASKAHEQAAFDAGQHDAANFVTGGNVRDFGDMIDQGLGRGFMDKIRPIMDRKFGNQLIHEDFVRSETMFKNLVGETAGRLNSIARHIPDPEAQRQLMANVMAGVKNSDPILQSFQDDLSDLVSQMIGVGDRRSLIDNAFFRNNTSIHHINMVFEKHGLSDKLFDADLAAKAAKANGTSIMHEAAKQSADWTWTDPLAEVNKMYAAFATTQAHQTVAQKFVTMARDMSATAHVPTPGYSLVGNDTGKSLFARYMPDNLYFRDDLLRQMHVVDVLSRQSMELNGPFGHFIRNYYKPLLDAWKYGMTLINPTHHIRNSVSDASLTYYAEGVKHFNVAGNHAIRAMATHNGYTGWDAIAAMQGAKITPSGGKALVKGKLGELSAIDLYKEFANRGNLPGFKQLEQLDEMNSGSALANSWEKITNTKTARTIGGLSEARDHLFRLQHGIQFAMKNIDNTNTYKTMDDLLNAASAQVRKWHPDGSDMTRPEQYFRLLIPFYSWQRKSIPLIAEAMLMNPARVNAIPKASYAVATAMGVHPDSLSDPFPQDQMFPSYLSNQLTGPVAKVEGKYYGINPGFAANDTLNTWVGDNPLRSLLGSVAPMVKAPFELAAGGNVGTGGKINDTSDYIDSQVPIIAPISRISGISVTGSLLSMIQGQGLDPQYQIRKGNKDQGQSTMIALTNWLSGMGISPMSQPNQINYAEIEKRNAAAAATGGK